MTFEDKQKAECIIYRLFECDMTEVPQWEKDRLIGELALLDLNEDEYDDVQNYLNNIMLKIHTMKEKCKNNLLKSLV